MGADRGTVAQKAEDTGTMAAAPGPPGGTEAAPKRPLGQRKLGRDTRWLERRGLTWYAVQDVPRTLRSALGKKRLLKSLGTQDLHVAVARRHAALADFQRQIASAQRGASPDPLAEAAMAWRGEMARAEARDDDIDSPLASLLADEADRIEREHGHAVADGFVDIATGRATPLLHHADSWLAEGGAKGPLRERTRAQYRSDLIALMRWMAMAKLPPTIEAITRATAGRYITQTLAGLDRGTANRKISSPSSYWRWLVRRGHAETNPWHDQSLAKVRTGTTRDDPKRAFTDDEVAALLAGAPDLELADLIRVAALSGMRLDEPYRLLVSDCAGGWFDLRRAKTKAGRRRIPIHSALVEIIERRTRDQPPGGFLFPEPGPERPGRERSMPVSKRFRTYRKRCGVHDARPGVRQSAVTFHSFRHWFVTKAREAQNDRALVAAVVGHEVGNITDDRYSGGPSDERKRACVESVRLPAGSR